MPKLFSARQLREWDAYTLKHEPIASIDLMERACHAVVDWIQVRYNSSFSIGILCGTGNNGGDGLGIARLLCDLNYPVKIWIVRGPANESAEFKTNFLRLPEGIQVIAFSGFVEKQCFSNCTILIDALFGSGLSRPLDGIYAEAIEEFNATPAIKLAIDIPSGLMADVPAAGVIAKVDETLSFQSPKLAFFLPECGFYVGQWHILDIGLSNTFIDEAATPLFYIKFGSARKRLKQRDKFGHKGSFGKALLIAGSFGKVGAAVLSARGALRSGLGLLTVHVPFVGYSIIQTAVPEAMVSADVNESVVSSLSELGSYDVIGIGPGIGQATETLAALRQALEASKPMVIDADALNLMSNHRELLAIVPANSILTPHPKEFERLAGPWKSSFERLEKQRKFAEQVESVVIVKGAHTTIALPDGTTYFNTTGNPGMATGGTGDVLTGLLTGLLAQGYSASDAAILGVFVHGLAGDKAAYEKGYTSLIASDLVDFIPEAFRGLGV